MCGNPHDDISLQAHRGTSNGGRRRWARLHSSADRFGPTIAVGTVDALHLATRFPMTTTTVPTPPFAGQQQKTGDDKKQAETAVFRVLVCDDEELIRWSIAEH